jgi:hypothetical protein
MDLAFASFAALTLAPTQANAALSIPIDTGKFTGVFNINSFTSQIVNGTPQLAAVGSLVGTDKKSKHGVLNSVVVGNIVVPVTLTGSCPILHLELGPLDLDLLGLEVQLSEIVLDITALIGPSNLLGNLLCSIAGLLDPAQLSTLIGVLNQILDLLS